VGVTEPASDVTTQLESYATELDTALVARNGHLNNRMIEQFRAMLNGDTEAALAAVREESKLRVTVRDVNETYAASIGELLSRRDAESGHAFRSSYLERAYRKIYSPTTTQRAFGVARNLDGLDHEVLAAIELLETGYLQELAPVNEQLAAMTRAEEPLEEEERMKRRIEVVQGGFGRTKGKPRTKDNKLVAAYLKRSDLNRQYREQLEAMLTEEQRNELPSERANKREERERKQRGRDRE
jgi:hypothetical protein